MKAGMEEKRIRVNLGKTKVMRCRYRKGQVENSGKFPCGICKKGVGTNSSNATHLAHGYTKNVVEYVEG